MRWLWCSHARLSLTLLESTNWFQCQYITSALRLLILSLRTHGDEILVNILLIHVHISLLVSDQAKCFIAWLVCVNWWLIASYHLTCQMLFVLFILSGQQAASPALDCSDLQTDQILTLKLENNYSIYSCILLITLSNSLERNYIFNYIILSLRKCWIFIFHIKIY